MTISVKDTPHKGLDTVYDFLAWKMTILHCLISYPINIDKVRIGTSTGNSFATELLNWVVVIMPSHTTTLNTYKSEVSEMR